MPDYIDPTNIGQLIDILQSETEGRHFDPTEVQSRLDDLMTAVGYFIPRANMSEEEIDYGLAYDEAEDQQTGNPREKVQHYKNILESPDPLGEGIIHGIYKTEINARARNRNSKDVNLTERLSHDFALLRKVANELMTYNKQLIRPGAPHKEPQRTLLMRLADLYVQLTNKQFDSSELPHSENSRFIRFCHLAMEPHLPDKEISTAALSKAWKRLKESERPGK